MYIRTQRALAVGVLENIKKQIQEKEVQRAVDRLITFLNRYFEKGIGNRKNTEILPKIYDQEPEKANSGKKYLNEIKNKPYLIHYFFYRDYDLYKKTLSGTYEKKVTALNRLKDGIGQIEQSNIPNHILYNIMRYYLALKLMRNQINHASESNKTDDEKYAIEQLEKFHEISMEIEFQNIKTKRIKYS